MVGYSPWGHKELDMTEWKLAKREKQEGTGERKKEGEGERSKGDKQYCRY